MKHFGSRSGSTFVGGGGGRGGGRGGGYRKFGPGVGGWGGRGGRRGLDPPPYPTPTLKNHKNIGFLKNAGPDPLKNHKTT